MSALSALSFDSAPKYSLSFMLYFISQIALLCESRFIQMILLLLLTIVAYLAKI